MLTVRAASEILGVSPTLVYALCARGKIEHERYGLGRGTIRIRPEALVAYQERSRAGPPARPASPTPAGTFRELDARRLTAAWRMRDGSSADDSGR